MSTVPPLVIIAAACIAGFIALIGMLISKENKISEFRQAWIDGQRADLATVLALAGAIRRSPDLETANQLIERFEIASYAISLRVNPASKDARDRQERWGEVVEMAENLRRLSTDGPRFDEAASRIIQDVVSVARDELKIEWERVKSGEPVFRRVRLAVLIAVGMAGSVTTVILL